MDHAVSTDMGKSWINVEPCFLDRGIRNPQTALIDGVYILHGRGEQAKGFVFYSSDDAYIWSKGFFAGEKVGGCYYSENILLNSEGRNFLLIQYSELCDGKTPLDCNVVNAIHRTLEIVKE